MNLSTLALILLAWQLMSNTNNTHSRPSQRPEIGWTDFLNDDTKNIINCVNTLSSDCSQQDKTSALFQMMSNPAVMNFASSFFGATQQGTTTESAEQTSQSSSATGESKSKEENVNSEGYRFETPSASSQEFFRPIDNIADAEIKHKLYWFYDNWYIK